MTTQRNAQPGDDASAAAAPTAAPTPAEAAPADVPAGADCDSDRLRRAADELLKSDATHSCGAVGLVLA